MKKLSLYVLIACESLLFALLFAGCSENTSVAGTAEEPNEFAIELESSSSNGESSSSNEEFSSSAMISSSSKVVSSSSETISSSSEPLPSSSSFVEMSSSSRVSDMKPVNSSLESYMAQFGLDSIQFMDGMLAARSERYQAPPTSADPDHQSASATEFDGPWPIAFVQQNIYALRDFFPEAYMEYAGLVDSIKNGTASDSCKLYMLNVQGNSKSIGFVIADISRDTVDVLAISAESCKIKTDKRVFRFLFRYCGEIDSRPEIVYTTVEADIPADKCPAQDDAEWISDN